MTIRNLFGLAAVYARREEGQTMAEYGVILAVITVLVVAALLLLAGGISGKLNAVTNILS